MSRIAINIVPWFKIPTTPSEMEELLEQSFGNDGVLFWLRIQRFICGRENHFYNLNDSRKLKYFSGYIKLPEKKCLEILEFMSSMDIIDKKLWSKKIIWLNDFVEEFRTLYKNRKTKLPERPDYLLNSDTRTDNLENTIPEHDSRNDNPDFTEHEPDIRTDKLKVTDDNEILGTTDIPPITPIIRKEEEIDKMRVREEENPVPEIKFIPTLQELINFIIEKYNKPTDIAESKAKIYIANREKNRDNYHSDKWCDKSGSQITNWHLDLTEWMEREGEYLKKILNNKGENINEQLKRIQEVSGYKS